MGEMTKIEISGTLDTETGEFELRGKLPSTPKPVLKAYKGVNLAGLEFGDKNAPGALNHDYVAPNPAAMAYFAQHGFNLFRIPFRWDRVQGDDGALVEAEMKLLDDAIDTATALGAMVVLDLHNYGRDRTGAIIAENNTAAFCDLWAKIASRYARRLNVACGLMNEPHDQPLMAWWAAVQGAINAIRTVSTAPILAPGIAWSGAWTWVGSGNAAAAAQIVDPLNATFFEVHQYFDQAGAGLPDHPTVPGSAASRLADFTAWCKASGKRAFLGEFGAPRDPISLAEIASAARIVADNPDAWWGFAYWAAGPWWGDYPLSIEPQGQTDAPQMAALAPVLAA